MIKDFLTKKVMERQLKDLPPQQREMMMRAIENNPDLFKNIAKEIKAGKRAKRPELAVTMEVMKKYQGQIQQAMGMGSAPQPKAQFKKK